MADIDLTDTFNYFEWASRQCDHLKGRLRLHPEWTRDWLASTFPVEEEADAPTIDDLSIDDLTRAVMELDDEEYAEELAKEMGTGAPTQPFF